MPYLLPGFAVLVALVLSGCGSGSTCTTCPQAPQPCDIPSNSGVAAVSLHSANSTYAVNDTFWVSVILYHVDDPFGASVEVSYPSDRVDVLRLSGCPNSFSQSQNVQVSRIEPAANRVSYGVSRLRGAAAGPGGNTVLFYLGCRAKSSGSAAFSFVESKLQLVKSDGSPIDSMSVLRKQNLVVTLR